MGSAGLVLTQRAMPSTNVGVVLPRKVLVLAKREAVLFMGVSRLRGRRSGLHVARRALAFGRRRVAGRRVGIHVRRNVLDDRRRRLARRETRLDGRGSRLDGRGSLLPADGGPLDDRGTRLDRCGIRLDARGYHVAVVGFTVAGCRCFPRIAAPRAPSQRKRLRTLQYSVSSRAVRSPSGWPAYGLRHVALMLSPESSAPLRMKSRRRA